MIIGQIKNGIVLDHITAGQGMELYRILGLMSFAVRVALIKTQRAPKWAGRILSKSTN
jgi:aspartate carbamoyltransferase regulatory subunit